MKKILVLFVLLASCKTEKGKLIQRQRKIRLEEMRMMRDFVNEHKNRSVKSTRIDFDKDSEFMSKIRQCKKEYDSLQKIIDTKYANEK